MTYRSTQKLVRKFRTEDGNSSIEFAMVFPVFIVLFMSVIEMGVMMTRYMMFERALDVTVREMRLASSGSYTQDEIKRAICDETLIVASCRDALQIEMERLDENEANWSFPSMNAVCKNRVEEIVPATTFQPGASHDTMYVRACLSVEPMFPWAGIGATLSKDDSGAYNMIAQSAFSVEPS